jgi:hypothetical protein
MWVKQKQAVPSLLVCSDTDYGVKSFRLVALRSCVAHVSTCRMQVDSCQTAELFLKSVYTSHGTSYTTQQNLRLLLSCRDKHVTPLHLNVPNLNFSWKILYHPRFSLEEKRKIYVEMQSSAVNEVTHYTHQTATK